MDIGDVISVIISVFALAVSIVSLMLSIDKTPNIRNIKIKPLNDSFDLLFDKNNTFSVELANYNNRDMLLCLTDGWLYIKNEKHKLLTEYYTIRANSVTTIELCISTQVLESSQDDVSIFLLFDYNDIFKRKVKYTAEDKEQVHEST